MPLWSVCRDSCKRQDFPSICVRWCVTHLHLSTDDDFNVPVLGLFFPFGRKSYPQGSLAVDFSVANETQEAAFKSGTFEDIGFVELRRP